MAKFPTEVEKSITVQVPIAEVYKYLWDVVGSSDCVPGLDQCKRVAKNTFRFTLQERSTGPVSMRVRYTAKYEGNGKDTITYESVDADGDNTEVAGEIRLQPSGKGATKILLRQKAAPDSPVPRLLQGLIRSFVDKEAAETVRQYLANVKQTLET